MKFAMSKGHNSCKNRSIKTKLELDLYHIEIYSHTKNEFNICNNSEKKSGKLKMGQTDRRTDGRTDRQTERKLRVPSGVAGRGLIKVKNNPTQNQFFNMFTYMHIKFTCKQCSFCPAFCVFYA